MNAALCFRKATTYDPVNAQAARKMAEFTANARLPAALAWWQRLVEVEPTLDNKVHLAAIALQIEKPPFPIASQTLKAIKSAGETNVAFHLVAAQKAIRLHQLDEAQQHLQVAGRLEPTNQLHQLNLAVLQLQSLDAATARAAHQKLDDLTSDAVQGHNALRSLAADALRQRHLEPAREYSRRLLALPQATFEDRLQYLTVLRELKSGELPAAIASTEREAGTNATWIGLTAAWLNTSGRPREALDWLKGLAPKLRDTLPVPLAEAECLVAAKAWGELDARLEQQRWDDLEFMRLAFAARAKREAGWREGSDGFWLRAVNATAAQLGNAVALLQVARDWGWRDAAEDLLWTIAKRARQENWPLEELQRHYAAATNTAGLYRVHQAFLERHPNSLEVKNNVAVFGLLLNRDLPRATALAREVYESSRTNAVFATTYALALHIQGNSAEGLKLLEGLPKAELQQPEIAAYYAMLLSATGHKEQATAYFAAAEKATLLPEERRLLAQARGQQ